MSQVVENPERHFSCKGIPRSERPGIKDWTPYHRILRCGGFRCSLDRTSFWGPRRVKNLTVVSIGSYKQFTNLIEHAGKTGNKEIRAKKIE